MAEPELCGDLEGDPYEGLTVECDLPKDHDGDHHAVVTWPQYVPPPPRDPSIPVPPGLHFKPEVWGKLLEQALGAQLITRAPHCRCAVVPILPLDASFLDEPKHLADERLKFQGVNGPTSE